MRALLFICLLAVSACVETGDPSYNITRDQCVEICGPGNVSVFSDNGGFGTCDCYQGTDGGAE